MVARTGDETMVPRSKRRRLIGLSLLALGVLLIAAVAWIGVRGYLAARELSQARDQASELESQLAAGQLDRAKTSLDELGEYVSAAERLTGDPIWRAAEFLPFAGPNLTAVREVSEALGDVAQQVAAPLLPLSGGLTGSSFSGPAIELQSLIDAAPVVAEANAAMVASAARIDGIDADAVLPSIRDAVVELRGLMARVASALDSANRLGALAPSMLGAEGERHYLLVFQNNAELRASGGIPGATALLSVVDGAVSIVRQEPSQSYPILTQPIVPLSPAELNLYGDKLGRYVLDANLGVDFARSGALLKAMAEPVFGVPIDGVIAIDPVVLGHVLTATGPLQLHGGVAISSDNAVSLLLSDVYRMFPAYPDQDRFFASVTSSVFAAIETGAFDPGALIAAIVRSGDEGRIKIWSGHEDEQMLLAATTLSGVLSTDETVLANLGVFLNDATGGKMGYYLDAAAELSCVDGAGGRLDVTLGNTVAADVVSSLPGYVTGRGAYGVAPGRIRTQLLVAIPMGSTVASVTSAYGEVAVSLGRDDSGRTIATIFVELAPGESSTIAIELAGANAPIRLTGTPGVELTSPERGYLDCSTRG